jgi:hypothetical protein
MNTIASGESGLLKLWVERVFSTDCTQIYFNEIHYNSRQMEGTLSGTQ